MGAVQGFMTWDERECQRGSLMECKEPICGTRRLKFGPQFFHSVI